MVKEVSPSAFERVIKRQRGEFVGSLEKETLQEKELRKVMRLNDQTQRIPGSYKRYNNSIQQSVAGIGSERPSKMLNSNELSLFATKDTNMSQALHVQDHAKGNGFASSASLSPINSRGFLKEKDYPVTRESALRSNLLIQDYGNGMAVNQSQEVAPAARITY